MKYLIVLVALFTILTQCITQKKPEYEFPAAMSVNVKTEYSKICEKGQVLYEINCGGCHNIKKGRKEYIPDFNSEQLKGYEIRITNASHEDKLTDESITAEELGYIMTFLTYKKKTKSISN